MKAACHLGIFAFQFLEAFSILGSFTFLDLLESIAVLATVVVVVVAVLCRETLLLIQQAHLIERLALLHLETQKGTEIFLNHISKHVDLEALVCRLQHSTVQVLVFRHLRPLQFAQQ